MAKTLMLSLTFVLVVLLCFDRGYAQPNFPFSYSNDGTNMQMTMTTTSSAAQWISIGFNTSGRMFPSDAIVCETGANTRCTDRQCSAFAECTIDTVQNIETVTTVNNGLTTFVVTRLATTTDSTDQVVTSATPPLIWASGTGATSNQHSQRGSFTVTTPTTGTGPTGGTGTTSSVLNSVMHLKSLTVIGTIVVSSLAAMVL